MVHAAHPEPENSRLERYTNTNSLRVAAIFQIRLFPAVELALA